MSELSPSPRQWRVLVYRVPTEPASKRVAIWRDLKRLGALYLQQCVCIVPELNGIADELERIAAKIPTLGGETTLIDVPRLRPEEEVKIVAAFRTQSANEYAEIIEECETKFVKEVEFEHFRQNYSFEEAEEIEQDLDKIRRWFDRVQERDWFDAEGKQEVERWLVRCQELLDGFEEEVYRRTTPDGPAAELGRRATPPPPQPAPAPTVEPLGSRRGGGRGRGRASGAAASTRRRHGPLGGLGNANGEA